MSHEKNGRRGKEKERILFLPLPSPSSFTFLSCITLSSLFAHDLRKKYDCLQSIQQPINDVQRVSIMVFFLGASALCSFDHIIPLIAFGIDVVPFRNETGV